MAMVNSTTQRFIFVNALNWLSTWNCDSGLTIAHSTAPCSSCAPNTHRNRDSHNPQPPEAHNPLFYSNIWRRAHVRSSTDLFSFTIVVLFLLLLLFALSVCLCRILAFTMCFVSSTVYGITCTDLCVSTTASTVVYCHSAIYTIESFRSADECSIRQQSRSRFYCWCAWIGSLLLRCVFFSSLFLLVRLFVCHGYCSRRQRRRRTSTQNRELWVFCMPNWITTSKIHVKKLEEKTTNSLPVEITQTDAEHVVECYWRSLMFLFHANCEQIHVQYLTF